jgi:DNA-binding CsgD family transcriptional regulator
MRAQIHDYAPGGGFDARHAVSIGLEDGYRRRLAESQTHQVAINPAIERIMKRHAEHAIDGVATALRSDTIGARDWYGSGFVAELRRPARIDDHIHTARLVGAKHADLVGVARGWGDPPFGVEERDLVHLFHTEVLGRFGLPDAAPVPARLPAPLESDLSPRERSTLALLLTGVSERRIAARLGISPHTTHGYVKAIYRKIGAKSRADLMARVLAAR